MAVCDITYMCSNVVSRKLATYEEVWNKASYLYKLVDAHRVGSQSEVGLF